MYTITTVIDGVDILKPLETSDWDNAVRFFQRASGYAERLTGNGIDGGEPVRDTRAVVRMFDAGGDIMVDHVENGRILTGD